MAALLNRARMSTVTTGTGTITLGSAVSGYATFAEAGAVNATVYSYCIEEGADFEIGVGTYTSSGTTFSRDTVTLSKIAGVSGTTKLTLAGTAQIFITPRSVDLSSGVLTTEGDILYRNSTGLARLAKGTALQFLRQNSGLTAPEWATAREVLSGARTYYVRTDGSDSNAGLVDSAGGAFLTIQRALNVVQSTLDLGGQTVTIQVKDGTFAETLSIVGDWVGPGTVHLLGNTTTPSNVAVRGLAMTSGARLTLGGFKFTPPSGHAVDISANSLLSITGAMEYGACAGGFSHFSVASNAYCLISANYTVSGSAANHFLCDFQGFIHVTSLTITFSGTPAWSNAGVTSNHTSLVYFVVAVMSGAATGKRYSVTTNSVVDTSGGGASFFPGNSVGTTATGGQYA